jgi:hypothetical protein
MKKRLLYFTGGLVLLVIACNPIEKRETAGPLLNPEDIQISVYNSTPGGNQIILINNTPNVGGTWDYVIAKSERKQDTILLPFLGTTTIKFYATTPGGLVMVEKDVVVTAIDHPADPMWDYLAGTGIKTWVWATDRGGSAYGNGGFKGCNAPCWWTTSVGDLTGWGVINDQMIFDLAGGPNYTLITGNTSATEGIPAGTYKGSFLFDKTQIIKLDDGSNYTVGNILLGYPVSRGFQPNLAGKPYIYTYNFLTINANQMYLVVPEPGAGSWGTAWFWMFKQQGYTYPPK